MRNPGLNQAIQAAGGVRALALRVGLSQPSISNWDKVPAERVLGVEAATGVDRKVLRPDLYQESQQAAPQVDETDIARAQEYALLSTLLVRAPNAALLKNLSAIRGDATPLGVAHIELAEAAAKTSVQRVEREYFDLFIGLGRGELLPYGSFYVAGFLHERPLARLREDLSRFGIVRADGNYEPEDHAATLCEIMAGVVSGSLPAPEGAEQRIFEKHLLPWIDRFFADLVHANAASFYRSVGTLGRVFMDIEKEAFALSSREGRRETTKPEEMR